jgi:integrase
MGPANAEQTPLNSIQIQLEASVDELDEGRKLRPRRHKIFTEDNVLRLPIRRRQYVVWDRGVGRGSGECALGLGILVSPGGVRSYRSTFYFAGSPKAHSRRLGRVGEMTLIEAREQCRQDRAIARKNMDPRADDPSTSDKYKAAVNDYVDREQIGKRHNVKAEECRHTLLNNCEEWHDRPLATIRGTEIQRLLERVCNGDEKRGLKARRYMANLLHARLNSFFTWCAKPNIGKIKVSPIVGIDKPFAGESRRERAWFKGDAADEAIKAIWHAADRLDDRVAGKFVKVLLLTGKRRTALTEMKWEQVTANWFWNAPKPRKENKRLHPVPLSSLVARILHPRQETGFVFPGAGGRHINVDNPAFKKNIIKAGAMDDFFLHGCRHIVETKMAELRIDAHIRDLLLDHAPRRGSGKTYDHHGYEDEMRAALEQWADHVSGLVQPEGVAVLR